MNNNNKAILMKIIFILIFIIAILGVVSVNAGSHYLSRQKLDINTPAWAYVKDYQDIIVVDNNTSIESRIPYYYEDELLFNTNQSFELGIDAGVYHGFNHVPNASGFLLSSYPTTAIRSISDNYCYAIYNTDSGYRLFLFFNMKDDYLKLTGFPIVYKNELSISDFENLNIGDSIEKVVLIDDVTNLYKKQITDIWQLDYKSAKFDEENGTPITSIHYLKDGLLKIEYEMIENGSIVVMDKVYKEDRILCDILGEIVNYNILESDLPE